ncbi:hypothetical protein HPB50_024103 [Hyalomma asiaticum]|uniref:Uncharacterized protein n=1 Tax=Hyalomma asiaticum TaxID=266040 RepID=A0ACB7S6A1_HYAAI|nr:hypothetical protein HPB50_024103 [Hyalomma asiaticum]
MLPVARRPLGFTSAGVACPVAMELPTRSLAAFVFASDAPPKARRDELERRACFLPGEPVLLLATVLAFARGSSVNQHRIATRTGTSTHFKTQDSQGNYRFGYDVVHSTGSSFHKEESSNGVKVGSYGLRDVDGRVRIVNYVADAQGFRADVRTNEPGTDATKDAASQPAVVASPPSVDVTAEDASSDESAAETGPTPAEVPATATLSTTAVPPVVADTQDTEGAGGDVAPPEVLPDEDDAPPRRRTKPRPAVFPPPKKGPKSPSGHPPRRTQHRPSYPIYVDAADVHIVGPAFQPAYPRRPGGFQVAAFHGGFPAARPFSPFGYFPAGVPQLALAPRHAAALHPAFYANPASAFLHSMQLSHAGFPFGQIKWPYHASFLPPVVAFPF